MTKFLFLLLGLSALLFLIILKTMGNNSTLKMQVLGSLAICFFIILVAIGRLGRRQGGP